MGLSLIGMELKLIPSVLLCFCFKKYLEIGCEVSDEYLERQIGIGTRNMFKDALKSSDIPFNEEAIDKLSISQNGFIDTVSKDFKLYQIRYTMKMTDIG